MINIIKLSKGFRSPKVSNEWAGCSRLPLRFTQNRSRFWERLRLRGTFPLRLRKPFRGRPTRLPILISLFLLVISFTINICAAEKNIKDMSFEEAAKKYEEITRVISFLKSGTPAKYPWSMNEFFDHSIYEKMVGNEFFGYYYDEGVVYDNPGNSIAVDTIAVLKGKGYEKHKDSYTRIFLQTLKLSEKHTYRVVKEARYSLGICIVSVKERDDAESTRGIVLESYIKDRQTGKHFYHRCGTGSPGDLDRAMRLSAVRIICNFEFLKQKYPESSGVSINRSSFPSSRQTPTGDRKVGQAVVGYPFALPQNALILGSVSACVRLSHYGFASRSGEDRHACPVGSKVET